MRELAAMATALRLDRGRCPDAGHAWPDPGRRHASSRGSAGTRARATTPRYAPSWLAVLLALGCGCPAERPRDPTAEPGSAPALPPAEPAPPTEPAPPAEPIALDLSRDGVHRSGPWEYRFRILAKGSRSEGTRGELLHGGRSVPPAIPGDFYATPWGDLVWIGDPEVLWGAHGWMPREPGATGGRQLAPP